MLKPELLVSGMTDDRSNSKRIAGGNKDTSMSAVSSSEGPIRQVDVYRQARDGKRDTRRDEGEDGEGAKEEASRSRSPWHRLQCQPTWWPSLSGPVQGIIQRQTNIRS